MEFKSLQEFLRTEEVMDQFWIFLLVGLVLPSHLLMLLVKKKDFLGVVSHEFLLFFRN